ATIMARTHDVCMTKPNIQYTLLRKRVMKRRPTKAELEFASGMFSHSVSPDSPAVATDSPFGGPSRRFHNRVTDPTTVYSPHRGDISVERSTRVPPNSKPVPPATGRLLPYEV